MLIQSFIWGAVYQTTIYYVPLYLQNARQLSIMNAAAIYIPFVGLQATTSIFSGLYITYMKRYGEVMWFGFSIWTL